MATSDDLAGLPTMPVSTYPRIYAYQIISGVEWVGGPRDRPVLMRGALRCRMATRGTQRRYATAVLERYVRRLKITETDPVRWYGWMHRHLLRIARQRPWWNSRWQSAVESDLRWFVCEYSVLIDGVRHDICDPERMQNVRMLARNARKYTGDLPALAVRGVLDTKMAINTR